MGDESQREQVQLGQRLRAAREYLGLSQELVAQQLNLPRASVSAMEAGKRKVSSLELKQLAQLYKRPPAHFLDEEEAAHGEEGFDASLNTLFRTTRDLSEHDRKQVLRFAQFLQQAGRVPTRNERS